MNSFSEFEVEQARKETPGCANVLHFNNAGAALMPRLVLDAVLNHIRLEAEIGGYEAYEQSEDLDEDFYSAIAALLNCKTEEVAFIENATRAWDMAFYSIPLRAGDRILTGRNEYASNYIAFLQRVQQTGARVEVIPSDESGAVSVSSLRKMIDSRTRLIAITHVPTNSGLINDAEAIGKIVRDAGVLYLVDACQSVGQMPVNVSRIDCDMLSATGRKFLRGPRGTGFLYVRESLISELEPPFLDLHAATWLSPDRYEIREDVRRFENWEQNHAGKIGLAVAARYAMHWGLLAIEKRVTYLADLLRESLASIPGVTVHDPGTRRSAITSFTVAHVSAEEVKQKLRTWKTNVSVSGASSTLLDMSARLLPEVIRASVHYYNTEEEVARFSDQLRKIAGS